MMILDGFQQMMMILDGFQQMGAQILSDSRCV